MADFTVLVSGVEVRDWLDPATVTKPSRVNAAASQPLKRYVGRRGATVLLRALVAGVAAPLDAALGGRLFTCWAVEAPEQPFAGIYAAGGWSSRQVIVPTAAGHYTIGLCRANGGIEHVHLDIA